MTRNVLVGAIAAAAVLICALVVLVPGGVPAQAEEGETAAYVGPKDCRSCHFKQFKSWSKTPLAKAFEVLKPGEAVEAKQACPTLDAETDYTKNADCLRCHVTAYGEPTGYPTVDHEWSDEEKERAELNEGITCEACHGPGSLYIPFKKDNKEYQREEIVALGAVSPPTAENCMPCHVRECPTMGEDYTFDFETAKDSDAVHEHFELKHEH